MKNITANPTILAVTIMVCAAFLSSCMFTNDGKEIYEIKTVDMTGIDSVKIWASSHGIQIVPVEGNEARIILSGKSSADKLLFSVRPDNNLLDIDCDTKMPAYSRLKIRVEIPAEIAYASINAKTFSGDVGITGFNAARVILKTSSGNINANMLTAEAIEAKTSSGTITAQEIKGAVTAKTISGGIKISYADKAYATDADTSSGGIAVHIPEGSGFTYEWETTSGSKDCEFGSSPVHGGGPNIKLKTISGKIGIRKR